MTRKGPSAALAEISPGRLAPVAWGWRLAGGLDPGVVPNADSVQARYWQIRNLEVCAPGSSHTSGHKRDALTDHGAGRVQGLCKDTQVQVQCVFAVPAVDVTSDSSGTVLLLIHCPFDGEVLLPTGHQRRSRRGQLWAGACARAGRSHRCDQAHQEHESAGRHGWSLP